MDTKEFQITGEVTLANLKRLIRTLSYREGEFTLASGKKSSFYVDLKASTLHPFGAYLIGNLVVQKAQAAALVIEAVGGLTLGADPIATAVSLAAHEAGLFWPAFIVRKEPKDHGMQRYIEGSENFCKGAKVLVVEDVTTTGASSLNAVRRLREAGYVPEAVFTVVDREEGGSEAIVKEGLRLLSLFTLREIKL